MREKQPGEAASAPPRSLHWEASVPIFTHPVIVRQLLLALGVPLALVAVLALLLSGGDLWERDSLYALLLVAAALVLSFALIMAVYGGRYAARFTVDRSGLRCETQPRQARRGAIIHGLTVALGLLTRQYSAAGAGMLAQSRQSVSLPWKRVRRVRYLPGSRTILVRGGYTENIALFCTADNYAAVEALVREYTAHLRNPEK